MESVPEELWRIIAITSDYELLLVLSLTNKKFNGLIRQNDFLLDKAKYDLRQATISSDIEHDYWQIFSRTSNRNLSYIKLAAKYRFPVKGVENFLEASEFFPLIYNAAKLRKIDLVWKFISHLDDKDLPEGLSFFISGIASNGDINEINKIYPVQAKKIGDQKFWQATATGAIAGNNTLLITEAKNKISSFEYAVSTAIANGLTGIIYDTETKVEIEQYLYTAVLFNNHEVIDKLISNSKINAIDVLDQSVYHGNIDLFMKYLDRKLHVIRGFVIGAIHRGKMTKMLMKLLELDPNNLDFILTQASYEGKLKIVNLIIELELDCDFCQALDWAASIKNLDVVNRLIEVGADKFEGFIEYSIDIALKYNLQELADKICALYDTE